MDLLERKVNRLSEYDYSTPNAYFITICTAGHKNLFWENTSISLHSSTDIPLSRNGHIVKSAILDIPNHYSMISVDHFAIMPNHVHLIMQIKSDTKGQMQPSPTISHVINQTKGYISKQIGFSVWQKGFYDHVIRGEKEYRAIWNYIEGNPGKWLTDPEDL